MRVTNEQFALYRRLAVSLDVAEALVRLGMSGLIKEKA